MGDIYLEHLDALISAQWQSIFASALAPEVEKILNSKDKRIYALYMCQVYHYAYHTPRSLAQAAANLFNEDLRLMHHFLEHAVEENGHDMMAYHDLKSMGIPLNSREDMPPPLTSTETMIAYVKFLSLSKEPFRSLGYHYWIEQPYQYIETFMQTLCDILRLEESQFLFYKNHKRIDAKHGKDVQAILIDYCKTEQQWESVYNVTMTTMKQFMNIIIEIIEEYYKLKTGQDSSYKILNAVVTE